MPETAHEIKVSKVRSLGTEIVFCKNTPEERQKGTDNIVKKYGATFIHPFDHNDVITGQATVAKEILEDNPEVKAIIPPVCGGGLLCGTGLSARYFGNRCKVYAAEPEGTADAIYSFKTGKVEKE
ncbi:MAG: threonine dehydratase [Arcticibacterium sp.]|jgi:threonine dehydratase